MTEEQIKSAALHLAEHTPPHLGKPTCPPIRWKMVDDKTLRVLLADGRSVRDLLADHVHVGAIHESPKHESPKHESPKPVPPAPKPAIPITSLPIHPVKPSGHKKG